MFSSSKFNADKDIPDLAGKVVLVTGGMALPQPFVCNLYLLLVE